MAVTPLTLPVIVSESKAAAVWVKFASKMIVPPPAKSPEIVKSSSESASFPISKTAPALTLRSASNVSESLPSLILEPTPMLMVSHPVRVLPASEPEMPLSARALLVPAPPDSEPMLEMSAPLSNVRFFESLASFM